MRTLIGLAFCYVLGFTLIKQGISALLWLPLGFAIGVYVAAQIVLPILLGLPRAAILVRKHQMRSAVFHGIVLRVVLWLVGCFGISFIAGFIWPAFADFVWKNLALNLGLNLGTLAMLLSPLSKKCRADFRVDFDRAYREFYVESPDQE